jgi:polysaccharide export outer membrane protein
MWVSVGLIVGANEPVQCQRKIMSLAKDQAPIKVQATPVPRPLSKYVLGAHDQIALWSVEVEELSGKTVQIDNSGQINVPLAGHIQAAGLTTQELEAELTKRLAAYVKRPEVSVSVVQFGSQPVSVLGAVNNPGLHQLRGGRTLAEVLAAAGGLRPEAGSSIKVTRRLEYGRIPLASADHDDTGAFSVAEVNTRDIVEALDPEMNIDVRPFDIISVPPAKMVYVVGVVVRAGGFVLNEKESLSALQALSLAGGLDRYAAPNNAKVLRAVEGSSTREEISVKLGKILDGKEKDIALLANDILFIPGSGSKKVAARAAEAAIQTLSGVVIWRGTR